MQLLRLLDKFTFNLKNQNRIVIEVLSNFQFTLLCKIVYQVKVSFGPIDVSVGFKYNLFLSFVQV